MNQIQLIDFWPDGYVGHTDSLGTDVGKLFLKSLFEEIEDIRKPVKIYSHFPRKSKIESLRKFKNRLASIQGKESIEKRKLLHGHLGSNISLDHKNFNVWYTSENKRPPLDQDFNIFLTHDLDPYDGRNIHLPIWATRLGKNILEAQETQEIMLTKRENFIDGREGICAVISNPEPVRMAFIKELERVHKVDIYGAFGNPLTHKDEILKKYKFNICFENDEFPGYVTEKPFEAWGAGCIPIWRGLDHGGYLNAESILNVSQLGFSESVRKVTSILNDEKEYQRITNQPILKNEFDFQGLRNSIIHRI